MRRSNDSRIGTVIASFDKAVKADDVDYFMEHVVGLRWTDWPTKTFADVIREISKRMPEADLDHLCADAKKYIADLADLAAQNEYETTTGKSFCGAGFKVWLAERSTTNRVEQAGAR